MRERFDRVLEEWIQDEELRGEWREYLHNHRPEPDEPREIEPLVFQGVTNAGSLLQVLGSADEYEVWVDGTLQERIAAHKDLSVGSPVLHFRWDGKDIAETFTASEEALSALADYVEDPERGSPPWDYASELLADGLIDVHFDLTPRGRRALGS